VSLPALLIGAHAKKQPEDLTDNDGDEDEGIFLGDHKMVHGLFSRSKIHHYGLI
jgi:hypothetical protein